MNEDEIKNGKSDFLDNRLKDLESFVGHALNLLTVEEFKESINIGIEYKHYQNQSIVGYIGALNRFEETISTCLNQKES